MRKSRYLGLPEKNDRLVDSTSNGQTEAIITYYFQCFPMDLLETFGLTVIYHNEAFTDMKIKI